MLCRTAMKTSGGIQAFLDWGMVPHLGAAPFLYGPCSNMPAMCSCTLGLSEPADSHIDALGSSGCYQAIARSEVMPGTLLKSRSGPRGNLHSLLHPLCWRLLQVIHRTLVIHRVTLRASAL